MLTILALTAAMAMADSTGAKTAPYRGDRFQQEKEAHAPARDAWLGDDKFRHFAMSYAVTAFAFAGARTLFDADASGALAVATGAAAGLLKEFYDRSRGYAFSNRDLVWDAAGVALGFITVRQTAWK